MDNVVQIGRQAEKSRNTRERVLKSTASLICSEGLPAASPVRITRHTGLSWGAVQHHFGSKDELLKTIVLLSRDMFNDEVSTRDYSGLPLGERISAFVDAAWQHYQSEVFLASVEITFWYRNNGLWSGEDIASDDGRTGALAREMIVKVFAGTETDPDRLIEAMTHMHCVLTGLAFQKILTGDESGSATHLDYCKRAMAEIIAGGEE
jgi:AcrR family transcriptional regulator